MSNQIPQTEIDRIQGQANLYATGSAELYEAVYMANYDGRLSEYLHRSSASPEPERAEGESDPDWESKLIRRQINESKASKSRSIAELAERAFIVGYFNQPNPPASFVDDIADGHLSEAWERCKPALLSSSHNSTPTALGTEGEEKTPEEAYRAEIERQLKAIRAILAGESPSFDEPACLAAEKKLVAYWKGKSEGNIGFLQGYACALVCIIQGHGISTEVEDAYKAGLPPINKLKGVIDDFDYSILKRHFK